MSGRSLRRLPVLAHARYIGTLHASGPRVAPVNGASKKMRSGSGTRSATASVEVWLDAMARVVQTQRLERDRLQK